MHRGIVVGLLFSLGLAGCASSQSFFTGQRARTIALLNQSSRPELNPDEALKLLLHAKETNENSGDLYMTYCVDTALAQAYMKAGDADGASANQATALEAVLNIVKKDGMAQSFYTLWLISYDIGAPLDMSKTFSEDESMVSLLGQFDAMIKQFRQEAESSEEEEFIDRLETTVEKFSEAITHNDVAKLRESRNGFMSLMDEALARQAKEEQPDEEERKAVALFRDVLAGNFDMIIAYAARDRHGFEGAARATAAKLEQISKLITEDQ